MTLCINAFMIEVPKMIFKDNELRSYSTFVNDDFIPLINSVSLKIQHLSYHE